MLPMQQPVLLTGGSLPPLNVFHNPVWMNSNKAEEGYNPNDPAQMQAIQRLSQLNRELDDELSKLKPMMGNGIVNNSGGYGANNQNYQNNQNYPTAPSYPKFLQLNNDNNDIQPSFPRINGFDSRFKETAIDFTNTANINSPLCIRREGMLKIRDVDQKDKDVVVTYAVLTKDRLSYFVNAKDESSIQGSIELSKIKESLKLINGFPTCFTIKTVDGVSDCSICAESEDSSREWINAITQNAVNCNTMSALNNLNKRGLLK